MKRYFLLIAFCLTGILFLSCTDDDIDNPVPSAPFRLVLDLNYRDKHVDETAGNIGVYLKLADRQAYENLVKGNTFVKTYAAPRDGADQGNPGYAGVLVVNTGIPDAELSKPLCAFDLCCPRCLPATARVVPDEVFYVKCPQCGSTYSLQGAGKITNGEETKLRQYVIKHSGNNQFIVVN